MRENLTKNARWVIFWAEILSYTPLAKPFQMTYNTGRHKYNVPSALAISKSLDFSQDKILRSMVYEVDVAIFPYAKQWKEVNKLADKYFKNMLKGDS